jgi:hypothetical protein
MGNHVHARALLRAAGILGGVDALSERLHVHPGLLLTWMRGSADVPEDVFLTVVDIVLERDLDAVISPPSWARSGPHKIDDSSR